MTTKTPFELPFGVKKYELIELIGSGAFSWVYRAIDTEACKTVAVKVILKEHIQKQRELDRLQRELDSTVFLRHDNLVATLDFISDQLYYFIVMEYCSGGTLYEAIKSGLFEGREQHAALIFQQIVKGVQFCHQRGVSHRDLKPTNILMVDTRKIKIADFGLCQYTDQGLLSTFCGSPCYAAPECIAHIEYDGIQSDMWSLGVILYEMLTKRHPWNISNQSQMIAQIRNAKYKVPPTVSMAASDLLTHLLKVNPKARDNCTRLLEHNWFNLVGRSRGISSVPQRMETLREIIDGINRKQVARGNSVVSPFLDLPGAPVIRARKQIPHAQRSQFPNRFSKLYSRSVDEIPMKHTRFSASQIINE